MAQQQAPIRLRSQVAELEAKVAKQERGGRVARMAKRSAEADTDLLVEALAEIEDNTDATAEELRVLAGDAVTRVGGRTRR